MKKVNNLQVQLDEDLKEKLQYLYPQYSDHRVTRKSIDARKGKSVSEIYSVEVYENGETPLDKEFELKKITTKERPIIVGTGPCGLFAALRLAERGVPSTILERGHQAKERVLKINRFWRYGELDSNSNVCFGEGGAGLYSDGKLITRIRSEHIQYVLNRLVQFGAPKEIEYLANPHVGSDKIRRLIPKIRQRLLDLGCTFHFNTRVDSLIIENGNVCGVTDQNNNTYKSHFVVLATGHSAQDIFDHLKEIDVDMEGKSFAVGLRVEHPQEMINKIQFRESANHPKLGAANYKLTRHDHESGVGVYSFCMCPGGYVLSSGTDPDSIVCNGMSNFHRNSKFANSGIVVSIDHETFFGNDKFGGIKLRKQIETKAYKAVVQAGGTKEIPVQSAKAFIHGEISKSLPSSSPSGVTPARLDEVLPQEISRALRIGLMDFERKMPGFIGNNAQLHGVESRTSCPLRITRSKETLESTSHPGLYPAGEGAGYAGGITSAAVDGINVAEVIVEKLASRTHSSL